MARVKNRISTQETWYERGGFVFGCFILVILAVLDPWMVRECKQTRWPVKMVVMDRWQGGSIGIGTRHLNLARTFFVLTDALYKIVLSDECRFSIKNVL